MGEKWQRQYGVDCLPDKARKLIVEQAMLLLFVFLSVPVEKGQYGQSFRLTGRVIPHLPDHRCRSDVPGYCSVAEGSRAGLIPEYWSCDAGNAKIAGGF